MLIKGTTLFSNILSCRGGWILWKEGILYVWPQWIACWNIGQGEALDAEHLSTTNITPSLPHILASVTPAVLWSFPAKLFHAPHWKNLLNGGWLFSEMLSKSISFYKLMLVNVRPSNLIEGERKRVMDINIIYIYIDIGETHLQQLLNFLFFFLLIEFMSQSGFWKSQVVLFIH